MNYKLERIGIGLGGLASLALGIYMYLAEAEGIIPGMLIRIGALLLVIWLAFPQLEKSRDKIPGTILGITFVCLLMIAARPKISGLIIAFFIVSMVLAAILKFVPDLFRDTRNR